MSVGTMTLAELGLRLSQIEHDMTERGRHIEHLKAAQRRFEEAESEKREIIAAMKRILNG